MNQFLNKIAIRNILSIRYNPTKTTLIKSATVKDFKDDYSDPIGLRSEKLLKKSIVNSLSNENNAVAISLSGGIDSTLLLGLIRKTFPAKKIFAICGVFEDGYDESIIAKKIAEKFEAEFHVVNMDSIFSNMPKLISITKKPKWNNYIHLIAKAASKFTKNFVTGDGADELFGGYTFRYAKFLNLLQPKDNWKIKTINYLECHNRDWAPDQENMFGSSIKFDWNEIYKYFRPYFSNSLNPLKQVMLADFNGKLLHDFIPMGKAISEQYRLKSFSPFLNQEVIASSLKLPISQKFNAKTQTGKLVLRKITKRLGIKHLDEKRGFSPSIFYDWKKHGKDICNAYILKKSSHIFQKRLINHNWVLRAYERVENDGDIRYLNRLISILALEIWYRIFISKEIKPSKKLH